MVQYKRAWLRRIAVWRLLRHGPSCARQRRGSMVRKHQQQRFETSVVLGVLIGLLCGFFVGAISKLIVTPCMSHINAALVSAHDDDGRKQQVEEPRLSSLVDPREDSGGLVLIGVMTAKIFLDSRIAALHATWARDIASIGGKVLIFSSAGSEQHAPKGVPVIGLPGVDDSYPPQKKSFMMLKYMTDYYGDKYKFFMRADDDVYIRAKRLGHFLRSLNSSRDLYIGQTGQGTSQEIGKMNLKPGDNFCMGGPGMIFSPSLLKKVAPFISECLKNLYTTHEDVEVGRCIKKHAGVSCTWAYEMNKLFFNNYKHLQSSFSHSLRMREVHSAMTMHPIKEPAYQFRLHRYMRSLRAEDLRQKTLLLQRQIHAMDLKLSANSTRVPPCPYSLEPSFTKTVPRTKADVLDFEFFDSQQFSATHSNPQRALDQHLSEGLHYVIMQVTNLVNANARQRGRTIDFKEILYGYRRVNPLHGADYILDLLMVYRKHKGKSRRTVPVRRHAYLQQTFTALKFSDFNRVPSTLQTINFILPLSGRHRTFLRFLGNYETVCIQGSVRATLTVVLYPDTESSAIQDSVEEVQEKHPTADIRIILMDGSFSRGNALQEGSKHFSNKSLLFFVDVDIHFDAASLFRIQMNTVEGSQVYYPVVFSQFDPARNCDATLKETCPPNAYDSNIGYWRQFGFGITSLYNSDFRSAGGFDLSIHGWGKEDVDLYERFLHMNMTVFRAVDPGLVHIFHPILCDPGLDAAQYQMCLGTKSASFASARHLGQMVLQTPEILNQNEEPVGAGAA